MALLVCNVQCFFLLRSNAGFFTNLGALGNHKHCNTWHNNQRGANLWVSCDPLWILLTDVSIILDWNISDSQISNTCFQSGWFETYACMELIHLALIIKMEYFPGSVPIFDLMHWCIDAFAYQCWRHENWIEPFHAGDCLGVCRNHSLWILRFEGQSICMMCVQVMCFDLLFFDIATRFILRDCLILLLVNISCREQGWPCFSFCSASKFIIHSFVAVMHFSTYRGFWVNGHDVYRWKR